MIIETEKLKLIPLTITQFHLLLEGIDKIEKDLFLIPSGERFDEHLQSAMQFNYNQAVKCTYNSCWLTCWLIILKSENKYIGTAAFNVTLWTRQRF